jgi:hypothetical protein
VHHLAWHQPFGADQHHDAIDLLEVTRCYSFIGYTVLGTENGQLKCGGSPQFGGGSSTMKGFDGQENHIVGAEVYGTGLQHGWDGKRMRAVHPLEL